MSEMTFDEAKEFWNRRGGPAFPLGSPVSSEHGMTLRDYFAAQALGGVIIVPNGDRLTYEKIAKQSYDIADAMLREREVTK